LGLFGKLLAGSCSGSFKGAVPNVFMEVPFSVKRRGVGAILEEPQIVAPPKRLWLLQRSAAGGAMPNTQTTHAYIFLLRPTVNLR